MKLGAISGGIIDEILRLRAACKKVAERVRSGDFVREIKVRESIFDIFSPLTLLSSH